MRHIFLNLKRFDIPREYGGVNGEAPMDEWGSYIISHIQAGLRRYGREEVEFAVYLPEAHLISAVKALDADCPLSIGCQGVYREDTEDGGSRRQGSGQQESGQQRRNYGAFTTNRTANAVKAMGCRSALIGHFEERRDKSGILMEAGIQDPKAVERILNQEAKAAVKAGLRVLYCIGEAAEEQDRWKTVLKAQIETGLDGVDKNRVILAYEPVWAIGPGKTPPDAAYITTIGTYIKELTGGMKVVYGGGLRVDNAGMLAGIQVMDGGLAALTRFQGEIGFYPDEFLDIVHTYLVGCTGGK